MQNLLPANRQEAFNVFLDEDDAPKDCHRHCTHFETDGVCCDCGEEVPHNEPIPIREFLKAQPTPTPQSHWDDVDSVWGI